MFVRSSVRRASALAVVIALGAIATRPLHAQTSDLIVGTVTDASGKPVQGAKVDAFSIETEVTRSDVTNAKGQYRVLFPDGTGQYRVSVKAIGKNPQIFNVARGTDDDRIVLNIRLGDKPMTLNDLVATAGRRPNADQMDSRPTAGESSRSLSGADALRLPIDAGDLAALAALAPGVIATAGTDSTAATFSVAGQSAAGNTYVVNGQTTTSSALPQDAVGRTRVITNTYDVARGNFSGGMVQVTTKGGSNRVTGSLSSGLQDKDLSWGGNTGTAFGAGNSNESFGAGFGGPLKRDKVFLFGSFGVSRKTQPVPSLTDADSTTLERLGTSPDSAAKFTSLVGETGLTQQAGIINPNRNTDAFTSVVRFDWYAGTIHSIIFTGQLQLNGANPQSIQSTSLPQVGGTNTGNNGSGGLRISSRFDNGMINAFTGGYTVSNTNSTPFLSVPAGRVTNYSPDTLGGVSTTTFAFGGNSGMPRTSDTKTVEITDEISYSSGSGTHRYALGLYGNHSSFDQDQTTNRYGTFTYASLADFQNNIASSFSRTLQPNVYSGAVSNEAIYLSDAWRPRTAAANNNGGGPGGGGPGGGGPGGGGPGGGFGGGRGGPGSNGGGNLQLNYGVRLEHSSYSGAPARNDSVFHEFGLDTHVLPSEFYVSPRAGFSYSIAAPEQQGQAQRGFAPPLLTIRGGVGIFRATMPTTLPVTAQSQSGLATAQTQLLCTGAAVPTANFNDYLTNPEDIPTECLNNMSTPVFTGVPNITGYNPNYGAAKTKRVSLGLTRRITPRVSFQMDAQYVRGVGQSASTDLNLNTATPRFTLANEGNRPVYADPSQIFAATGQVPLSASRIDQAFGSVNEVFSSLENLTKQVTFTVSGTTSKQVQLNLSYTLMSAQDQGGSGGGFGGFGGGNPTAGNPNLYTWATSSNSREHNFQASVLWPVTAAFEISLTAGLQSGSAYTPIVAGDINGDGSSRDDRAFVFNPATTTDTAVANGMQRLLNTTSGNAKKCLESQIGQIAGRNTCFGPWTPSLNPQINYRPALFDRRLQMQFRAVNLLGGLDELINGDNNTKGWGGTARPDPTLLTVTGFNPTNNQFIYSVNSRFGNTSSGATAIRNPFQVYLGLTYAIGYDQRTQQIQSLSRGFGGATTGAQMLDTIEARFRKQSVATAALDRKDTLVLSKDQVTALEALVDSSNNKVKLSIDSLRPTVAAVNLAGSAADANGLMAKIIPFFAMLSQQQRAVHDAVQKILTDVQWALIPDSARNPVNTFLPARGAGGGPGLGGGGFGGGGRGGRGGGE